MTTSCPDSRHIKLGSTSSALPQMNSALVIPALIIPALVIPALVIPALVIPAGYAHIHTHTLITHGIHPLTV